MCTPYLLHVEPLLEMQQALERGSLKESHEMSCQWMLTIDKEVVEISLALHRGIQESCHIGTVFRQLLHLPLVVQTELRVDHVPVLTMPHKQRNGPVHTHTHTFISSSTELCQYRIVHVDLQVLSSESSEAA